MANIKSQKKRIITNEKSRLRNRAYKAELKTAVRRVREAVAAGDGAKAYAAACYACKKLDQAASKGIIHKNQAANRKSGVMALANTIVTAEDIAAYQKPTHKAPATTGNKKAAAKAARKEALAAKSAAKAESRKRHEAAVAEAAAKKAAAEAAAAAEAEAEEAAEEE
ncbi:MAG: 30S ribosomal protein S20 [Coriobacteriia bacterium]|nr:30S ribosomal protein S20 [Coriobacteriia bacterium]